MHQMLFLVDIFMPFVVLRYSILGMDICVAVLNFCANQYKQPVSLLAARLATVVVVSLQFAGGRELVIEIEFR